MQKLQNNFQDYYYMTENGEVYNSIRKKYVKMASHYRYVLMTKEGKTRTISLKNLYKLVFNKNYCIDNIENLEEEQWKEIKGTDQKYYISNKGRVKSLCDYQAIIMKPYINQNGYYKIGIQQEGKQQQKFIHCLVAEAFEECGKAENENWQVHHIDYNKQNNCSNNLIFLSAEEHYKKHNEIEKGEKK